MPKLLSRSKHEEFKSNSALQIRNKGKKSKKNTKKMESAKFGSCSTVHPASIVHPALFLPAARSCFLTPQIFVAIFCFFLY